MSRIRVAFRWDIVRDTPEAGGRYSPFLMGTSLGNLDGQKGESLEVLMDEGRVLTICQSRCQQ